MWSELRTHSEQNMKPGSGKGRESVLLLAPPRSHSPLPGGPLEKGGESMDSVHMNTALVPENCLLFYSPLFPYLFISKDCSMGLLFLQNVPGK